MPERIDADSYLSSLGNEYQVYNGSEAFEIGPKDVKRKRERTLTDNYVPKAKRVAAKRKKYHLTDFRSIAPSDIRAWRNVWSN